MKRWILPGLMFALAGCANASKEEGAFFAKAREACEAQGKQFVLDKAEESKKGWFSGKTIAVASHCAGPGEPGYVAPHPEA
jgi:hypothetical protein